MIRKNLLLLCKIFCSEKFYKLTLINHIIYKIKELEKLDELTPWKHDKSICSALLECLTRFEMIFIELDYPLRTSIPQGDVSKEYLPEMWELAEEKMLTVNRYWWDAYESKERIEFLQELKVVIKNKKTIYPWWATS